MKGFLARVFALRTLSMPIKQGYLVQRRTDKDKGMAPSLSWGLMQADSIPAKTKALLAYTAGQAAHFARMRPSCHVQGFA